MSHGTGTKPTVLLIEADTSLRRLIALGLQFRGLNIISPGYQTSQTSQSSTATIDLSAFEAQLPDIIVLDIDGNTNNDHLLLETIQEHPLLSTIPLVIVAWECPVQPQSHLACLTKPFDARTLHATIEQLLVESTFTEEVQPPAILLAPRTTTTSAPSIWPLVTAAGLLLAFIGLMGQLLFLILGACIVIVSLLLWTLGASARREVYRVSTGQG